MNKFRMIRLALHSKGKFGGAMERNKTPTRFQEILRSLQSRVTR